MDNDTNDPWDSICFDQPFYKDRLIGIQDGYNDKVHTNYASGYQLGKMYGIEYGVEIGYVQGIIQYIKSFILDNSINTIKEKQDIEEEEEEDKKNHNDNNGDENGIRLNKNRMIAQIDRSIQKLQKEIDEFPLPSQIFSKGKQQRQTRSPSFNNNGGLNVTVENIIKKNDKVQHVDDQEEENDDQEIDILSKIQTIRSRYKLLLIQLGIKNPTEFSIEKILSSSSSRTESTKQPETTLPNRTHFSKRTSETISINGTIASVDSHGICTNNSSNDNEGLSLATAVIHTSTFEKPTIEETEREHRVFAKVSTPRRNGQNQDIKSLDW